MQNLHLLPQTFSQAHHASGIHQINGLEPPHTTNSTNVKLHEVTPTIDTLGKGVQA